MAIGKTIALSIWTFVGKVMSLLFNTLFRFVIAFQGAVVFEFHGCSEITIHSDSGAQFLLYLGAKEMVVWSDNDLSLKASLNLL